MYNEIVRQCLELSQQIYRKYLLSANLKNQGALESALVADLGELCGRQKGIGWLSIAGGADRFIKRGGAWVCVNLIKTNFGADTDLAVRYVSVVIFSHKTGASFGNIIAMGLIEFERDKKYFARKQADGGYLVERDGEKIKLIKSEDINYGLSEAEALEFAQKFGMLI